MSYDPYAATRAGNQDGDPDGFSADATISSDASPDDGPDDARVAVGRTGERAHPAVWGLTGAGFVCALAGSFLPWLTAVLPDRQSEVLGFPGRDKLYLADVGGFQASTYSLGWSVLLALIVMSVVAGSRVRRASAGAALGWAGGQCALLVALAGQLEHGSVVGLMPMMRSEVPMSTGMGMYASVAGVLLLGAAALLLLRSRARRPDPAPEAETDAGPFDLTVTPLPPPGWGKEGTG
ncbi:MAG TPA: hypothetical protein VK453_13775 [Micromonosporaceae bacterium]|nr:hypothetical protein [Micromonosporaceae bacterium]